MNLRSLLNPVDYIKAYPEKKQETIQLNNTTATYCKFNQEGNLLCVGCFNGEVLVYDYETKEVLRKIEDSYNLISCILWYKKDTIIVCSYDAKISIWNYVNLKLEKVYSFKSVILHAELHPTLPYIVAFPYYEKPCVINMETHEIHFLDMIEKKPSQKKKEEHIIGALNGDLLYVGNSLGLVSIIDIVKLQELSSFYLSGNPSNKDGIRSIRFSSLNQYYMVSTGDKIRLFYSEDDSLITEFKNVVFSTKFDYVTFSSKTFETDSDWIIGAAGDEIYIFDIDLLNIKKNFKIQGKIISLEYHPTRPILLTGTNGGTVHVYTKNYEDHYSSFAPDFIEIEENEFYAEREDEYDVDTIFDQFQQEKMNEHDILDVYIDENYDRFFIPVAPRKNE